jgi:hypothetical protein
VDWLGRIRRPGQATTPAEEPEEAAQPPVDRAAPGIAALFADLREDGSHAVLDLGASARTKLGLYSRYARRIRFADLLSDPPRGPAWTEAFQGLRPHPQQLYDLVLAWNLLDRLPQEERPPLVRRLAQITTPDARLYLLVDASGEPTAPPLRFSLLDTETVRQEPIGPPAPTHPQLLPAEVERLLAPFEVVRAFTLRMNLREYVAMKGGKSVRGTPWRRG